MGLILRDWNEGEEGEEGRERERENRRSMEQGVGGCMDEKICMRWRWKDPQLSYGDSVILCL